jgi:BirA family biotin operon repressor/biotin-[acetyl-CoA-carboxylase] ligase
MPGSPYSDLNRPPLHETALRRALITPDGLWTSLQVVAETGSTNADLGAAARAGAAEGAILIAERQTAGKGRLNRSWLAPARAALTFSVLLRPAVPAARLGWLPLLAGVALAEAVGRLAMVEAGLKWPNDLLIGDAKVAGILATSPGISATGRSAVAAQNGAAVVLGIGLNVSQRADELPPRAGNAPPATSLALADAVCTDREPLLRAILRRLAERYSGWAAAGGDPDAGGLRARYRELCRTLGRQVRAELPGGEVIAGVASDVDEDGRLVMGGRTVAAGDVIHLR